MELSYHQSVILLALGGTGIYNGNMKRFPSVVGTISDESAFFEKEGVAVRFLRRVFSRENVKEVKIDKRVVYYTLLDLHHLGLVEIVRVQQSQGDDNVNNYAYHLTTKGRRVRDEVIPFVDASRKRQDYGRVFEVED